MGKIANILLRITGDSDDARRELARTARDLAAFDRTEAEADVDVETTGARAKIKALRAELAMLARQEVNVDVDVDASGAAAASAAALGAQAANVGARFSAMGISAGTSLASIGAAALVLIPIIVALTAAVAALAASLGAALAGASALVVAGLAMLGPALILGIGAVQRFSDQADIAGTAANRLKTAAQGLGEVFSKTLGPAADAIFGGMAKALPQVAGLLGSLRGAFTGLGQSVSHMFTRLGNELARPAWAESFRTIIGSLAAIVRGPGTSAFLAFARVLRNIATAAAPLLVSAMQGIANAFKSLASSTSDIGALRSGIAGLLGHLRSWLSLMGALGNVVISFFAAAAPAGQKLADAITNGANGLARWLRSAKGQERIKQFFAATLPLAGELVKMLGKLAVTALQLGQALAPVLKPFVQAINAALNVINSLLDGFNSLPGPIQVVTVAAIALGAALLMSGVPAAIAAVVAGVVLLGPILDDIAAAAKAAAGAIADAANAVADFLGFGGGSATDLPGYANMLATFKGVGEDAGKALGDGIRASTAATKRAGQIVGIGVSQGVRSALTLVRNAGKTLGISVGDGVRAARAAAIAAARGLGRAVGNAIQSFQAFLRNGGRALGNAVAQGLSNTQGRSTSAARTVGRAVGSAFSGLEGQFASVGASLGNAMGNAMYQAFLDYKSKVENTTVNRPSATSAGVSGGFTPGIGLSFPNTIVPSAPGIGSPPSSLPGTGGMVQNNQIEIIAPAGGNPDAEALLALLNAKLAVKGGFA